MCSALTGIYRPKGTTDTPPSSKVNLILSILNFHFVNSRFRGETAFSSSRSWGHEVLVRLEVESKGTLLVLRQTQH